MTRATGRRDGWLWLILLLSFLLHTYHLGYPVWDYHNWRQAITLMLARDFARHDFPLWHPQVAWIAGDPSAPSYFAAEFSVQSILAATLYKIFGENDALPRMVVMAFSLLGTYCLYDLLKRRASLTAARLGALLYALLPYQIFFGRVFMADVPALSLTLAALDVLDRWAGEKRPALALVTASALMALAILQKPKVMFAGLPILYLFWSQFGRRLLSRWEFYLFALIACLPEAVWYAHAVAIEPQSVISALNIPPEFLARRLDLWLDWRFIGRIFDALLHEVFSPLGFTLAIMGFSIARGTSGWIWRLWVVGGAVLLAIIPGVLSDNLYYLGILTPGGAALGGLALARLANHPKGRPLLAVILVVFAAGAIESALPLFHPDRLPSDLGVILHQMTQPNDLLATEVGGSPIVLYAADRRGWLLNREFSVDRLEQLRHSGALYYAASFMPDAPDQRAFFHTLEKRYLRLTPEDAPWQIFDLEAPHGALDASTARMTPSARTVNYGDQILFRGMSVRPLGGWPAAYEVVYEWQCIQTPALDWRAFVHVTDRAGHIVAQQDHSPQAGWYPAAQWRAGEVVRERYVWALPSSLAPGAYQIRIGWFDPVRGTRLPIRQPSLADNEDRALAAEIQAPPPPQYGWFSVSR